MSDAIIGAIIGGACTLAAAIITANHSRIAALFHRRGRKLHGHWAGTASEKMLPASRKVWQEADMQMDLKQSGQRFWGVLYGTSNHGQKYSTKVSGRMEDEHYVTMQVRASSFQEFNFGMLVLELDHKGTTLTGYSLANGFEKHGISLGQVKFEKIS